MRIAWFTPLSRESAIGAFSLLVAGELSRHAEVELWIPETVDALQTDLPVVRFGVRSVNARRLRERSDIAVYNLGNNQAFHQAVMAAARREPGVVILHDRVMHHFFLDEARYGHGRLEPYLDAVRRWYGPEAESVALKHLGSNPFLGYPPDEFVATHPLMEEALLGALGVVVHSEGQLKNVRTHWTGPSARLDLPIRGAELAVGPPPAPIPDTSGRLRLMSFGVIGSSKQIHVVLDALAARPDLRHRVSYTVAGPFNPESEYFSGLVDRVERYDLGDTVTFLGRVSDEDLAALLRGADAFINLRLPSTEGGSASLVEQLLTGRPVVVSPSGVFGEQPDEAVIKIVSPDAAGVADAIDRLLADPSWARRVGLAGRRVARRFTAEAYARGLHPVLRDAAAGRFAATTVDRIGDLLRGIGGAKGLPLMTSVATELASFLAPQSQEPRNA